MNVPETEQSCQFLWGHAASFILRSEQNLWLPIVPWPWSARRPASSAKTKMWRHLQKEWLLLVPWRQWGGGGRWRFQEEKVAFKKNRKVKSFIWYSVFFSFFTQHGVVYIGLGFLCNCFFFLLFYLFCLFELYSAGWNLSRPGLEVVGTVKPPRQHRTCLVRGVLRCQRRNNTVYCIYRKSVPITYRLDPKIHAHSRCPSLWDIIRIIIIIYLYSFILLFSWRLMLQ